MFQIFKYLSGVDAAELRQHLPYMDAILSKYAEFG